MSHRPRLSLVVGGRNDNYGKTFAQRFQTFLRYMASLDDQLKSRIEIIVVEWNPPKDTPSLAVAMDWTGLSNARIFTVSSDIHAAIPNPGKMPMLEFFAKNAGVRRARGDWVISTNPDIILSPDLLKLTTSGKLNRRCFYRTDRYDFRPDEIFASPGSEIFVRAHNAVFQVHTRPPFDPSEPISWPVEPGTDSNSWPQSRPFFQDRIGRGGDIIECCGQVGDFSGLHTQASGDFMMASRDAWSKVRGHWERTDTFTHLDGMLTAHLYGAGYTQKILLRPHMVLHMDHTREEQKTRPVQAFELIRAQINGAVAGNLPNPNDANWGLGDVDLPETTPWSARRNARFGWLAKLRQATDFNAKP